MHDQGGWREAAPVAPEQAPGGFSPVKPILGREPGTPQDFSATIFAQPGQKPRLLVGYTSKLAAAEAPYRVRLEGASRLDLLDVTVRVETEKPAHVYELVREHFTPDRDFSLPAHKLGKPSDFLALHAGKYALARIEPETTKSPDLTFLVDTSASEPTPLPEIADFLSAVSEELAKGKAPPLLTVVAFDQDIAPIVTRARAPLSREQLAPLAAHGRLGGTDLNHAFAALIAQRLPHRQIAMLSDFENTIPPYKAGGDGTHRSDLERVDSLVADAAAERALLEKFAGPLNYKPWVPGVMARIDDAPSRVARLLSQPTPTKAVVLVKGASWSSPPDDEYASLRDDAPPIGSALWAFGEYEDAAAFQVLVNGKAKSPVLPVTAPALSTLLEQVVSGARLNELVTHLAWGYENPAEAAQSLSEIARLAKERGLTTRPGQARAEPSCGAISR